MEEITNIFNEIKANLKALPGKTKNNFLLILVIIFLFYISQDIKLSFRRSVYDILIIGLIVFFILFNFSFVKEYTYTNILIPIMKYLFGEEKDETEDAKNLLK